MGFVQVENKEIILNRSIFVFMPSRFCVLHLHRIKLRAFKIRPVTEKQTE